MVFVAVMIVVGRAYMENRALKLPVVPPAQLVSMQTSPI